MMKSHFLPKILSILALTACDGEDRSAAEKPQTLASESGKGAEAPAGPGPSKTAETPPPKGSDRETAGEPRDVTVGGISSTGSDGLPGVACGSEESLQLVHLEILASDDSAGGAAAGAVKEALLIKLSAKAHGLAIPTGATPMASSQATIELGATAGDVVIRYVTGASEATYRSYCSDMAADEEPGRQEWVATSGKLVIISKAPGAGSTRARFETIVTDLILEPVAGTAAKGKIRIKRLETGHELSPPEG